MSKEIVEIMIAGGKASPGPQMGQSFGPLGVNIQEILGEINNQTKDFAGMKVPVTVSVDTETKEFEIEVGTPPVSELIKKELNIKKGSGLPHVDKVGNLAIEQVIKITRMKSSSLIANSLKAGMKSVIGSCVPMGVLIEGMSPVEAGVEVDSGKYDELIKNETTEVSAEKLSELSEQLKATNKELEVEKQIILKKAADAEEAPVKKEGEEGEEGNTEEKKEEKKE